MKQSTVILAWTLAASAAWSAQAADLDLSKLPPAAKQKGVTYVKDIKPLLEASCVRCHGEQRQKGGLRLDSLEATLKGGEGGKVIEVGKSEKSSLVIAVARIDEEKGMPPVFKPRGPGGPGGQGNQPHGGPAPGGRGSGGPSGPGGAGGPGGPGGFGPPPKPLTPEQVALVRAWVDQGAK